MATSQRAHHRTPVVAGREDPLSEGALRLLLFCFVVGMASVLFALALLPAVGSAGRAIQRFTDEFTAIGADVELSFPKFPERSTIYAADGTVLATLYLDENRKVVRLARVSDVAQKAVLAIEDARFYDHPGIDYESIIRALITNVQAGGIREGASTITQQLVRNVFPREVGTERTLARKIQEARVATRLEREYSKDEILELYLNEVYFGRGVYGIATAAEYYFATKPADLTIPQAALLAGLIAAPERYSPDNDKDAALQRRNVVIDRMAVDGFITEAEAEEARAAPLDLRRKKVVDRPARAPFFVQYIKNQVLSDPRFGKSERARIRTLFQGGLRIHTTLEPDLQRTGQDVAKKYLPDPKLPEAALASVDVRTGAIKAMVSSENFEESQVNLATGQGGSGRQSGSAFKPFTLVAAFEKGIPVGKVYNAASGQIVDCTPYGPTDYRAVNAEGGGGGYLNLTSATARSVNAVFVQLAIDTGPPRIVEAAHRMGIESDLPAVCSLTLGTGEVTPLEMANAFATLANEGKHCEPFAITRVLDRDREVVFKQRHGHCEEAVQPRIAARVVSLLQGVVTGGTGTRAALGTWPVFGKTGTTNDYADAWFSGCTRQICSAVWVGHKEGRIPMINVAGVPRVYGGTFPAMIWHDFMSVAMQGLPAIGFPAPPPPESATVPDVVGKMQDEAERILAKANFTTIAEEVNAAAPEGEVVGQSPGGGATVTAGSTVTIEVSTGKAPRVKVPNVIGLSEEEAKKLLREAGLVVDVQQEKTDKRDRDGKVADQSPEGGTRVQAGSRVTIWVYRYEKPEPEPSPSPEGD